MPLFGVIGGSGLYEMPGVEGSEAVSVDTPYGPPSAAFRIGKIAGREVAFLPRHGAGHTIQPHRINYRANLYAFRELGVRRILSVGASGGINTAMQPGDITVPDQIIDVTSGRQATYFEEDSVVHVDMTEPYCPELRALISEAAAQSAITIVPTATYICVNGPRLETAAEIRAFASWGADIVGMTAMPEAGLARELGLCLAGISVVTNVAAGISGRRLTTTEVVETMHQSARNLQVILMAFFGLKLLPSSCSCAGSLDGARM